MKKQSITKTFTRLFLASCALFLCLLLTASLWFTASQKKTSEEYLSSSLNIMSKNMEEYFYSLETIGFGISSNWSVINLYSGAGYADRNGSVENSYQMMSLLCGIESSIADIMIVDTNGIARSYFAGVDYGIVSEVPAQKMFRDPYDLQRSFYFFPPESKWSDIYFVYCVPILNLNTPNSPSQKVATGLLLCNKSQLSRLLKTDTALSYEYYGLYEDGNCIFSSSPQPAKNPDALTQSLPLSRKGLTLQGTMTPQYIQGNSLSLLVLGGTLFVSMALVLLLLWGYVRKYITSPIHSTKQQLLSFDGNDLSARIEYTGITELDTIIVDINHMIDEIKNSTRQIILTQNSLYETELRTKEAELYALQSQINPHFLYNTLQCICGLASMNRTKDIREVALSMSDVFKYSIHPGTFVECAEEINIIYQYLSIYKIRYNGELDYEISVDEPLLDCRILKMIIQPTVENAMLHAYRGTDKKPVIRIFGRMEGGDLMFNIIDNGAGIPRDKLLEIQKTLKRSFSESIQESSSFGLGLYNIDRRIKLVYGESYGISLFSNPNGTQVDIRIPPQAPPLPALEPPFSI